MSKVSIIIPAFNVENFIGDMLEAIDKQTYDDYEVLMIDDGSTDHTAKIMEEYSGRDKRFKLYSQENQGVSAARNRGLDVAQGKYVVFYDADDSAPRAALENLVAAAEAMEADLTIGKFKITRVFESNIVKSTERLSRRKNIDRFDTDMLWNFSLCNKMFKRETIEKLGMRFDQTLHITEDGLFITQFVHQCKKMCGCPFVVYEYHKRPFWEEASATQDVSEELIQNTYQAFKKLEEIVISSAEAEPDTVYQTSGERKQDICARLTYGATLYKRFAKSDLLAGYYKNLWIGSRDLQPVLSEYLNYCKKEMFPSMWEQLVEQNFELRLEEGIKSREAAAADPTVSIILTKKLPMAGINGIINACYKQEMPFFEILADRELEPHINEEYMQKANFHILQDTEAGEGLLQRVNGLYTMVLSEELWLVGNTLKEMIRAFHEDEAAQSISVPIMRFQDGKMAAAERKAPKKSLLSNMLFISGFLAYENPKDINWCERQIDSTFMLERPMNVNSLDK